MANIFQKALAKVTFWDQNDDRKVAQDDEEERKRKAQAAVSISTPAPSSVRPTASAPNSLLGPVQANKPLTIGSQSQTNPATAFDFNKPLVPAKAIIPKSKEEQDIDAIAGSKYEENLKNTKRNEDVFGKIQNFFTRNDEKIAKQSSRTQAVNEYQDRTDPNFEKPLNPVIKKYQEDTKAFGDKTGEEIRGQGKQLDDFSKGAYKAAEVAQYVPITGSVLNLGLAGSQAIANDQTKKDIQETRNKIDFGMTTDEYNQLDDETKNKLETVRNIGLAASPLDFLGVGGAVKSTGLAAAKKGITSIVKKEAIDEATKTALKKAITGNLKRAAVPTVLGGAVSAAGQEYLTGEIDPLETAKSALLIGGTSLLTPATQTSKIRKGAIESMANNSEALKSVGEATKESASVPGRSTDGVKVSENPTVEIAPGVKVQDPATRAEAPKPEVPNVQAGEDINVPTKQGGAQEPVNIPDPANPIALAPVNTPDIPRVVPPSNDVPIADFTKGMDVPLRPVGDTSPVNAQIGDATVPQDVASVDPGELRVSTKTDAENAQGNEALKSDAQAIANGELSPATNPSLASTEVDTNAIRAAQQAEAESSNKNLAAPRTYERMVQQIEDPATQAELLDAYPDYNPVSIKDEQAKARQVIGAMSPEQLVESFKNGIDTSTPSGFMQGVLLASRLGRSDVIESVPGAKEVASMAANAVAKTKSGAGQSLGMTRILFENMPPVMKRDMLIDQLGDAGKNMQDADRSVFLRLIEKTDEADTNVSKLEDEAQSIKDQLKNSPGGANVDELANRYSTLDNEYQAAKTEAGNATADAVKFYDGFKEKGPVGSQIADTGRGLMLSGIGGRVFDNISTTGSAINDIAQANASAGVGKIINKITGNAGEVIDDGMTGKALVKGLGQGAREVFDSFRGKGNKEVSLESFTKGEANRSGVGDSNKFNRFVNNVVDIPTKLSKGIETARAEQLAKQEAKQLGLEGPEGDLYAKFSTIAQDQEQKHQAVQMHMRTNMLHQNAITDILNGITKSISGSRFGKEHPQLIGTMDVAIKNQVAPFTSFLGGNLHRAVTDKNMLYNVTKATYDLSKGNLQGFADQIGNLAVNGTQALAVGYTLSAAGVLTDTDANGNDYGGVYIHLGDRYIPVSVLGAAATPIIFGQAVQSSVADGEDAGDIVSKTFGRAVTNTFASAGVASVFGGENSLQQTVSTLASGNGDNVADPLTKYGAGILRQYANPSIFGDINAAANNPLPFGLNPNATGMAPQVDATKVNADGKEVKNVQQTELNRITAGIPGLSQTMDRSTEKTATDLLDRGLKSTRESGDMKDARETTESLADMKKLLTKDKISTNEDDYKAYLEDGEYDKASRALSYKLAEEQAKPDPSESKVKKIQDQILQSELGANDVPITDDGIKARTESGDYEKAIQGLNYQLQKSQDNKDIPASKLKKTQDDITRLQVARSTQIEPKTIALYDKTSASEWRAMGNPESEDYDPDTYQLLAQYDANLAASGVSGSTKDGSKQKFYNTGSGSGGGGKGKGISTSIATNDIKFGGFTPIKAQGANFGDPKSSIPILQRVKNNDRSKDKKISVSRGA